VNKPEDKDGFEDEDGCPEDDNDKDYILDVDDKCPLEKEVFNGNEDKDGCPDDGKELVKITETMLQLNEQIKFKRKTAKIRGKLSYKVLKTIATILKLNSEIRVRIEGHTDSKGVKWKKQQLSEKRAKAVLKYLVKNGIQKERLIKVGNGGEFPLSDEDTKKSKDKNNRIEFHIIP